jgi:hypothetical protein
MLLIAADNHRCRRGRVLEAMITDVLALLPIAFLAFAKRRGTVDDSR